MDYYLDFPLALHMHGINPAYLVPANVSAVPVLVVVVLVAIIC